jgi:hypothetical protein
MYDIKRDVNIQDINKQKHIIVRCNAQTICRWRRSILFHEQPVSKGYK